MILCFDIGNTNIVLGMVKDKKIVDLYRFATDVNLTVDDYAIKFKLILNTNYEKEPLEGAIISSVVPGIDATIDSVLKKYFGITALFVAPGIKSGLKINTENPKQLGADLLIGLVGAYQKYQGPTIVVDLGTATKLFVVSSDAEILGGIIYPGLISSQRSLVASAAKLNHTAFYKPKKVIGRDTNSCIQSGAIYGTASVIEGLVKRIKQELKISDCKVVLTGGIAHLLEDALEIDYIYEPNILIEGLIYLYYRNINH